MDKIYFTQQELKTALEAKGIKDNTSAKPVIDSMVKKGVVIEGYNDGSKGSINEPSALSELGTNIKKDVSSRISNIKQGLKEVPQAYNQEANAGVNDSKVAGVIGAGAKVLQQPLNIAGNIAGAGWDILGNAVSSLIPDSIKQQGETAVKDFVQNHEGLQKFMSDISVMQQENPDLYRAAGNVLNIAPTGEAKKIAGEGINILEKAGKNVVADTVKVLDPLTVPLKVDTAKISPEIMNRVARVNPTDANNFKNLTGESIGEYLAKTGNFGAPDEIITNEASKFTKALNAKDTAMASLPGTYKNGAMEDLINGIKEKALATSGGNVKSPYLKTATTLENKLKKDGLTMKEISDAIRLYEKEIKLGYNKTLNPEKVQLATNIDRAAREFQDATAKQLGFENLPELNKQIQTSRAIVDSLGKKVVSNDLLNGVSLTDYITLSGGNPTSVGMFLTKKIFSNKGVQAKIAKMLSETASPSEIKAIIGETKFPRLEVGKTKIPTQDLPIKLQAKGKTQSQADINLQKILKDRGNIPENSLISEAKKYKTTVNIQDKNDLEYLGRILSEDNIKDIKAGKMVNFRGTSYEDLAKVNIISKTPQTIEQQLSGKIKDVKLKSDTFYHGTSAENAKSIMSSGFKRGSDLPEETFRGGGYGKIQSSISLTETPKDASRFSTLSKNGEILEVKLKPNSKVVSIQGVEDAVDLEDYISYLIKQKIDAVYIGGGEKELVVINKKAITPTKSQLTDIWNKVNKK